MDFRKTIIGTKAVPETTYKHIEIKEEIIEIDYDQGNIQQTSFPVQARLSAKIFNFELSTVVDGQLLTSTVW